MGIPVNRRILVVTRRRIDNIIGSDDKRNVGGGKVGIDVGELEDQVVGYPGFRQ
ncbi:MAG: hypothetical protein WAK89_18290 [Candidatus Sulfotelmatobacter sp.]